MDWILGGIGSAINSVGNLIGNAQQNSYNRSLAEYQNAFNLEMWNRQNEYNSPQQTMQRLVSAGINPRSVNGLNTYANAGEAPHAAEYNKKAPLSSFSDIAMTALQMQQIKASTEKMEAEKITEAQKALTEQTKQLELLSRSENYRSSASRDEDRVKIEILNALRHAHQWGDSQFSTSEFNTRFPEHYYDTETYGIRSERAINDNESVRLKNLSEESLQFLRHLESQLKKGEIQSLESIPREWRFLLPLIISIFK